MRITVPGAGGYVEVDIPEAAAGSAGVLSSSDKNKIDNLSAPPFYNVKVFGAKGDGVTDDTAAIQATIAAAVASGGDAVCVPAGNFVISSSISFSSLSGMKFIGAGQQSTRFIWKGAAGGTLFNIAGCSRCRWSSFSLVGSGTNDNTGILYNGILGTRVSTENLFEQIFVESGCAYGIRIGTVAYQADQSTYVRCRFTSCSTAAVSIEDANAVLHNFYDCHFHNGGYGITAGQGIGGSFNLFGCGFTANGGSSNALYDIEVYPSSRGTAIVGCWAEGSSRFLHTMPGSTATQVSLVQCSVNGMLASDGKAILLESTGGCKIDGGRYKGTYTGAHIALQVQLGSNNNHRTNISVDGTVFEDNPFATLTLRNACIRLTNVQIGSVMVDANTASTEGFLARGTPASPMSCVVGNSMFWAAAGWFKVPSGTVLSTGANAFSSSCHHCQGSSIVRVVAVTSYGGLTVPPLITCVDNGDGTFTVTFVVANGFTLTSDLVFKVEINPEPYSVL